MVIPLIWVCAPQSPRRLTASSAAARSSNAVPTDLNSVISASSSRPAHCLVIGLAHIRGVPADQVEMGTGAQPFAADQRLRCQRGAGHDIGAADGLGEIAYRFGRDAAGAQLSG